MDTETLDIVLIDFERAVRQLADIDIMWSHRETLTDKADRVFEAKIDADNLDECRDEFEKILDTIRQLIRS